MCSNTPNVRDRKRFAPFNSPSERGLRSFTQRTCVRRRLPSTEDGMQRTSINSLMAITIGGLLTSGYLGGVGSQDSTLVGGQEPSSVSTVSVAMVRPLAVDLAMPSADVGCV